MKKIILLILFATINFATFGQQGKFWFLFDEDREAPATPTNFLVVGNVGDFTLTWTDSPQLDVSKIYIYRKSTSPADILLDSVSAGVQTYTDPDWVGGYVRYFCIRAVDYSGNYSGYTSVQSDTTLPVNPVIAVTGSPGGIAITNTAIIADSLRIYRGETTNPTTWVASIAPNATYIDSPLTAETIYHYRAKALTGSILSGYSTSVSDTALPVLYAVDLDGATEYMSKTSPANLDLNGSERLIDADNSTFENDKGDWADNGTHAITQSSTQKYAGSYSGKVIGTGVGDTTTNFISLAHTNFTQLVSGEKYTLELWANADSTGNGFATKPILTMKIGSKQFFGAATDTISIYPGLWKKFVYNFQATSAEVNTPIKFYLSQADTVYIDNVKLRQRYDMMYNVWVKPSSTPTNYELFYGSGGLGAGGIALGLTAGEWYIGYNYDPPNTSLGYSNTGYLTKWTLVTVTYETNDSIKLYLDGVLKVGADVSNTSIRLNNDTWFVGKAYWDSPYMLDHQQGESQIIRFTDIATLDATKQPSNIYYRGKAGFNMFSSYTGGTITAWYKWAGANDAAMLNDGSASDNDLTGTNVTTADRVIILGY